MTRSKSNRVTTLKSFVIFTSHFLDYCWVLRGILGALLALIILLGVAFAYCEGIPVGQGIYFSAITSTAVGYGDITPKTGIGQCISVMLACLGLVLFGLVVAVATRALAVTIEEHLRAERDYSFNSDEYKSDD